MIHAGVLRFLAPSILLAAASLSAQDAPPPTVLTPGASSQSASQENPQAPAGGKKADNPPSHQNKITAEQAAELFRSVDTILKFDTEDTGLPLKSSVRKKLVDRDEVERYLKQNLAEDKGAQRLQRSELVLKKFGLLPRDFDLQTFLVALLREQVAGYYDPKTKEVNLLDWLDPEEQKPVLAHELTHALQDQSFDLEKWMKSSEIDLDEITHLTAADIAKDEQSDARQAVVEGQAMAVLVDYMLAPTGQSLLKSPQIAEAMKQGMLVGTGESPAFNKAPIFIKESLTFPYRYGLDFVAALLRDGGKSEAFTGSMRKPPETTRQIMQPETYLSGEQIPLMPLPDFETDFKDYERFDVGAMGEFDVALLADEYAGTEISKHIYPSWRGGYYFAARPKTDASAPLSLLYVSRWASPASAEEFAAIYAGDLGKRYKKATAQVEEGSKPVDFAVPKSLDGTHTWLTEEGAVVIEVAGPLIVITEGFDPTMTDKFQKELSATH